MREENESKPPTRTQAEIAAYIDLCLHSNGCPPSIRQIGDRFGIGNPNGVKYHLEAMRSKGIVDWQPGKSRTLRLLPGIPVVGEVG